MVLEELVPDIEEQEVTFQRRICVELIWYTRERVRFDSIGNISMAEVHTDESDGYL